MLGWLEPTHRDFYNVLERIANALEKLAGIEKEETNDEE